MTLVECGDAAGRARGPRGVTAFHESHEEDVR